MKNNIGMKAVNTIWVQSMVGFSYNTAASVLNGLTELDIFHREKVGREWQYSMCKRTLEKIIGDSIL